MKRELTNHKLGPFNEFLKVEILDEAGKSGACHEYLISQISETQHETDHMAWHPQKIIFQDGSVDEAGVNGISNEILLCIVEDRLMGFQSGTFSCRENAVALTKLQECIMWLQRRTRDRIARGVEGTNQK